MKRPRTSSAVAGIIITSMSVPACSDGDDAASMASDLVVAQSPCVFAANATLPAKAALESGSVTFSISLTGSATCTVVPWSFSATTAPGVVASFAPTPNRPKSVDVTLAVDSSVGPGSYPVTLTDSAHTFSISTVLSVGALSLSSPPPATLAIGSTSARVNVAVAVGAKVTTPTTLAASGLPPGVTAAFSPPSLVGTGTVVLTLAGKTTSPVTSGAYPFVITATNGSTTAQVTASLDVASLFPGAPPPVDVTPLGATETITIPVAAAGTALHATGLPTGVGAKFSPITGSPAKGFASTLTLNVPAGLSCGPHPIVITGTNGAIASMETLALTQTQGATVALSAPTNPFPVGTPAAGAVTVSNIGTAPATITIGVTTIAGLGTFDVDGQASETITLPAGGAHSLAIDYASSGPAVSTGSLTVSAAGQLCAPITTPQIDLVGGGLPCLSVDPPGLLLFTGPALDVPLSLPSPDPGYTYCGSQAAPRTLTLTNSCPWPIHVAGATLGKGAASPYAVTGPDGGDPTGLLVPPAGGTATLTITPAPVPQVFADFTTGLADNFTLRTDNPGDQARLFTLSQRALGAYIPASSIPTEIDFPGIAPGGSTSVTIPQFTNLGNAPISLFPGPVDPAFRFLGTTVFPSPGSFMLPWTVEFGSATVGTITSVATLTANQINCATPDGRLPVASVVLRGTVQ
jgi:hypothetical protein